jgi:hypothetical protein
LRRGSLRLPLYLFLGTTLLLAAASCGSISSSATDAGGKGGASATGGTVGSGGTTGNGGTQGSGGNGGSGGSGGMTCDQIQAAYKVALVKARACSAGATNQCQTMASTQLGCNGCPTFVNDDSGLSAFASEWSQAQCDQMQVCTNIACLSPKGATCRAGDGGGAICVDSLAATP